MSNFDEQNFHLTHHPLMLSSLFQNRYNPTKSTNSKESVTKNDLGEPPKKEMSQKVEKVQKGEGISRSAPKIKKSKLLFSFCFISIYEQLDENFTGFCKYCDTNLS